MISLFPRFDVPNPLVPVNNQRKPSRFDKHERGYSTRNPAIPVGERVYLREAMMKPRGLHFRRNVLGLMPRVHIQQPIHFRGYLLRRAILMYCPIGQIRAVGSRLVFSSLKWLLKRFTKLIDNRVRVLIPKEGRVQLFYVACR